MTVETDFLKARGQICGRILKLESELEYWRDELKAFDRVETTVRRLAKDSSGQTENLRLEHTDANTGDADSSAAKRTQVLERFSSSSSRKRGDLRRLILFAVKSKAQFSSAKDIERTLLGNGYKPVGKHLSVSVFKTLNRLADAKLIERKREDAGRVWYRAIQ